MPPPRTRPSHEESKAEPSSLKDKPTAAPQSTAVRGRRNGAVALANGNNSKEAATPQSIVSVNSGEQPQNGPSGIAWSSMDREVLQAYRSAYRLDTPSSFKSPLSHIILNHSAIGKQSPTMAAKKSKRRVAKDQLALAVRKNFNALAVHENDVIVNTLYTARSQDKPFRMKFAPNRPR